MEPGPKRILVYGVTGSGKTTFARALAQKLDLPFHSVDELTWLPNWTERPLEEQIQIIAELCQTEEWVFDSAYGKWLNLPLDRVDLIIGLDYPRWLSLGRLIRRSIHRAATKTLICNGNIETWPKLLSRDSIIAWHFRSFKSKRTRMRTWADQNSGAKVILLRHPREAEALLSSEICHKFFR